MRLLGASLTLAAFSASFAESVWAATCPPDMEPHAAASAGPTSDHEDTLLHIAGHDPPPGPRHGERPEGPDAPTGAGEPVPPCPVAMVPGQCAPTSLAGTDAAVQLCTTEGVLALAEPPPAHALHLVAPPFHPPQA